MNTYHEMNIIIYGSATSSLHAILPNNCEIVGIVDREFPKHIEFASHKDFKRVFDFLMLYFQLCGADTFYIPMIHGDKTTSIFKCPR